MAPPNPRVVGAFRAMKALGITEDKVKPVLKNLLRLYNKNWDLIEEENYRALADAIFDDEESKVKEAENKKSPENAGQAAVVQNESEPALKRQRLKQQLSEQDNPSHSQNHSMGATNSLQSMGNGSHPGASPSLSRNKGKQPISGSGISLSPMKKSAASQTLIKPKDEPITDDLPRVEVPVAIVHPGSSSKGKSSAVEPDTNGKPETNTVKSPPGLEIASSLSGEVKIILNCSSVLERPDFHMPTLDEVVKLMEDKCLKRYKELDPNFSMMKVMTDVCQCFWEMGTESAKSSTNE